MEDSKKKPIMIGVIVVCLLLAVAVTYISSSRGGGDIKDMARGEMWWVKCSNPDCETEYQTDKKDYLETLRERSNEGLLGTPPMICKDCGKESIYKAEKCGKCGLVFFGGAVRGDFADRCPECGHSNTEEARKAQ